MIVPGFINGAYKARSTRLDAQECINLYPEMDEGSAGKSRGVLIGTPGLELKVSLGTKGHVRGLFSTGSNLYAVSHNILFYLDESFNKTSLQVIKTTEGPVSFAYNGSQVLVVDGADGYIITTATNTVNKITSTAFPKASHATFQDGRFIVNDQATGRFYISGSYDGLSWDELDYATAEGSPDNIIALISNGEYIWLFGTSSTEVWGNNGNTDFTFGKIPGTNSNIGCSAPFSVAKLNNDFFWLGGGNEGKNIVYISNGYGARRISTHAVEFSIGKQDSKTAIAYCYQEEGHSFYVLSFSGITWAYDLSTGVWHRRSYLNGTVDERQIPYTHTYHNHMHFVSDRRNSNIYKASVDIYTDSGDPIRRVRTMPGIQKEGKRIRYKSLKIDMDTGAGGVGEGDPEVMLQWSDDGGSTWSNELWVSAGKIGEFKRRVLWRRLGMGRDRVFRVAISAPIKVCMNNAYVELEV